jgi:hypothetical protein
MSEAVAIVMGEGHQTGKRLMDDVIHGEDGRPHRDVSTGIYDTGYRKRSP